jgi:putative flippase GtrA
MNSAHADRWCRVTPFITVGAIGFVVQISTLAALTSLAHWNWLPATALSVELAVLHNFLWHERWTWTGQNRRRRFRTVRAAAAIPRVQRLDLDRRQRGVDGVVGRHPSACRRFRRTRSRSGR